MCRSSATLNLSHLCLPVILTWLSRNTSVNYEKYHEVHSFCSSFNELQIRMQYLICFKWDYFQIDQNDTWLGQELHINFKRCSKERLWQFESCFVEQRTCMTINQSRQCTKQTIFKATVLLQCHRPPLKHEVLTLKTSLWYRIIRMMQRSFTEGNHCTKQWHAFSLIKTMH